MGAVLRGARRRCPRLGLPDCTPEFIGAMANAIYTGTYRQLRLHTPLEWLGKADIIRLGDG